MHSRQHGEHAAFGHNSNLNKANRPVQQQFPQTSSGGHSSSSMSRTSTPSTSRWFNPNLLLSSTPSAREGLSMEKELSYRQQAANFIQDMGQRLQVTQLCINTAIVYMQRFYLFHSFQRFHRNTISAASLFLAAKVEEQPRKLEHVIKVAHICLHRDQPPLDTKSEAYLEQAHELVTNENILLQTLGFDVAIDHPHTHVVKCVQLVRASKDLAQSSYFMATNSLHLTTFCLRYPPTLVACVCIHLACKWSELSIPLSAKGKEWFTYIDSTANVELLEKLTEEFLLIFEKCPARLKKKILQSSNATKEEEERRAKGDILSSQYQPDMSIRKESSSHKSSSNASKSGGPASSTGHSKSRLPPDLLQPKSSQSHSRQQSVLNHQHHRVPSDKNAAHSNVQAIQQGLKRSHQTAGLPPFDQDARRRKTSHIPHINHPHIAVSSDQQHLSRHSMNHLVSSHKQQRVKTTTMAAPMSSTASQQHQRHHSSDVGIKPLQASNSSSNSFAVSQAMPSSSSSSMSDARQWPNQGRSSLPNMRTHQQQVQPHPSSSSSRGLWPKPEALPTAARPKPAPLMMISSSKNSNNNSSSSNNVASKSMFDIDTPDSPLGSMANLASLVDPALAASMGSSMPGTDIEPGEIIETPDAASLLGLPSFPTEVNNQEESNSVSSSSVVGMSNKERYKGSDSHDVGRLNDSNIFTKPSLPVRDSSGGDDGLSNFQKSLFEDESTISGDCGGNFTGVESEQERRERKKRKKEKKKKHGHHRHDSDDYHSSGSSHHKHHHKSKHKERDKELKPDSHVDSEQVSSLNVVSGGLKLKIKGLQRPEEQQRSGGQSIAPLRIKKPKEEESVETGPASIMSRMMGVPYDLEDSYYREQMANKNASSAATNRRFVQ